MTEREKVIEWLDFCIRNTDGSICECEMSGCPYLGGSDVGNCFVTLMTDALALLKAQEPRVMTLEEYKAWMDIPFCERDPIFHEMKLRRGPVTGWTNTAECNVENYGKTERCWTSRPTDEQREATLWE